MKINTNYSTVNMVYAKNIKREEKPNFKGIPNPIEITGLGILSSLALIGCAKMLEIIRCGEKEMSELDKFNELKTKLEKKQEPIEKKARYLDWEFYINSTPENMEKMQKVWDEFSEIYKDKKAYEKFKSIDGSKFNTHDAKLLKDILKDFDDELNTGDEKKALRDKENEIAQKNNTYVPTIDGKEVSKAEIASILQKETNPQIRKKAYEAKIKGGDLIADDLIAFVKMRNEYAKTKGYDNFFDYTLKETYDVDAEFLDKLINDVYSQSQGKINTIRERLNGELREFFGTDELKAYHYNFLLPSNPSKDVNDVLEKLAKTHPYIIEEISKKAYEGMGYDVDALKKEGKLTLDLYPRKGKNTHGFCFGIDSGRDARILANLKTDVNALDTLNHEMGHCVHYLGVSTDLPYFDRADVPPALTEAIAMMMGDIIKREDVLKDVLPKESLKKFKDSFSEDEANFIASSLRIIDFERNLYKNPDCDPKKLWQELTKKYLNRDDDATNEWATIPHYISHPAYYQNYFRAALMKAQIYNHLKETLGNITENKNSANYMIENIFRYGSSLDEYDLIKNLTGKEFSADDFTKSL